MNNSTFLQVVAAGGAAVSSVEDLLNMGEDDFEVESAIAFQTI